VWHRVILTRCSMHTLCFQRSSHQDTADKDLPMDVTMMMTMVTVLTTTMNVLLRHC